MWREAPNSTGRDRASKDGGREGDILAQLAMNRSRYESTEKCSPTSIFNLGKAQWQYSWSVLVVLKKLLASLAQLR